MMRLDGIVRCQPCRTPELRTSGSYSSAPAAIISWLRHGSHMACTDRVIHTSRIMGSEIAAMRTYGAQLQNDPPAVLYGWLRPMPSNRGFRSGRAGRLPGARSRPQSAGTTAAVQDAAPDKRTVARTK